MAELFEVAAVPEAGAVGLDEEEAHAARSAVRVGPDDHDDEVAHLAVRDEGLLAGDDVFTPVANGFGADALQVAAGAGLGHGDRTDGFAGDHTRQPLLLLLLAAIMQQIAAADIAMDGKVGCGTGKPRIGEFFDDDGVVSEGAADASKLLWPLRKEQAGLAGRGPKRRVNDPRLF